MVVLCFLWGYGQNHLVGQEPGALQEGGARGQQDAGQVRAAVRVACVRHTHGEYPTSEGPIPSFVC